MIMHKLLSYLTALVLIFSSLVSVSFSNPYSGNDIIHSNDGIGSLMTEIGGSKDRRGLVGAKPSAMPTVKPSRSSPTVKPTHSPTYKPTTKKTLMPTDIEEESPVTTGTDDAVVSASNSAKKKGILLVSISTVLLVLLLVTSIAYYLHLKQKQEEYNAFILKSRREKQRDISIAAGEKTYLISSNPTDPHSDDDEVPTGYITGDDEVPDDSTAGMV